MNGPGVSASTIRLEDTEIGTTLPGTERQEPVSASTIRLEDTEISDFTRKSIWLR